MPHLRERHGLDLFKNLMTFSPIVGLFGHRQVGKTTFVEDKGKSYFTFDSTETRKSAEKDPARFLRSIGERPVVIDECQMVPALFPELKEFVRTNKKPGQFILTGSVRFSSRRAIRESLTGRIATMELLPFCLTEIIGEPRARTPLKLAENLLLSPHWESSLDGRTMKKRVQLFDEYLDAGGMPGLFAMRNLRLRQERLRDQVELILGRDLQLVQPTPLPFTQLMEFVRQLARHEMLPHRPSLMRKVTRISETTQKKLLETLEAIFMVRHLPIEGYRRGFTTIVEDQYEHLFLCQEPTEPLRSFESAVWRNLRASFNYETGLQWDCFQFLENAGRRRIPFAFRTPSGTLGILPILESKPSRHDMLSAKEFLARYDRSLICIVTKGQPATEILDSRILKIPAERILFE